MTPKRFGIDTFGRMIKEARRKARCDVCDREVERVLPIFETACHKCAKVIAENDRTAIKSCNMNHRGEVCFFCKKVLGKLQLVHKVNPEVCPRCMKMMARSLRKYRQRKTKGKIKTMFKTLAK